LPADELSDYRDCSEAVMSEGSSRAPVSAADRLKQLEGSFIRAISETDRCEKPEQASGGGGGGGGGTLSSNASSGEKSLAVNQSLDAATRGDVGSGSDNYAASGKEHEDLENVDNSAILRAQIKARADQETDPVLKGILIKKYESLK
jgi:hypothetical protein